MCQKQLNSYCKKQDGSICNDLNATDNTEISHSLCAGDSQGWTSFAAIRRRDHCQLWTMALVNQQICHGHVICSVDNNNTTVGHLSRQFSRIFWLMEKKRMQKAMALSTHSGGSKIPYYMTLHGNKLAVQAKDIIVGEKKKLSISIINLSYS